MSFYIMGPLLGPVLGPVMGGFVSEHLGYKWVFIITSIVSGVAGVYAFVLPLRESYHPLLRERLIKKSKVDGAILRDDSSRKVDEEKEPRSNGQRMIRYVEEPGLKPQSIREILLVNMTRPFVLFFRSFVLFILALFMAL